MIDGDKFAAKALDVVGKPPKDEGAPPTSEGEEPDDDQDGAYLEDMHAFITAVHAKDGKSAVEAHRRMKRY